MHIETLRLTLRGFESRDEESFIRLIRDKMAQPDAVYDDKFPTDAVTLRKILAAFIEGGDFFAICLKNSSEVIGFVALNKTGEPDARNLGYCIRSDMRGAGLGREAAAAAVSFAFSELHTKRITAGTAAENLPSVRLLAALGFRLTEARPAVFACDSSGEPIRFVGNFYELDA